MLSQLSNGLLAGSGRYRQIFQHSVVITDRYAVTMEKRHRNEEGGSLVAVIENMTAGHRYPIRGGQFKNVRYPFIMAAVLYTIDNGIRSVRIRHTPNTRQALQYTIVERDDVLSAYPVHRSVSASMVWPWRCMMRSNSASSLAFW